MNTVSYIKEDWTGLIDYVQKKFNFNSFGEQLSIWMIQDDSEIYWENRLRDLILWETQSLEMLVT